MNTPETSLQPSKAEWERLLNRVVESTPFRRSTRLRDFLMYVGNEVVLHGAEDLPEQQIGTAVFGRSPSYDTSQDNIVRVNATELRRRIDLYFANEGLDEPLIFEIPRGSYVPIFRIRQPHPVDHPPPHLESPPERTTKHTFGLQALRAPLPAVLLLVIAALAACLIVVARRNSQAQVALHKWQSAPALRAFWGNFFGKGLAPEIVLADGSFVLAQDVLHRHLSLKDYLDYSYRAAQSSDQLSSEAREQENKDLATILKYSSGSIGDFRVARRITELETGDDGTRLVFAREYAGHRLRWNNTIFVGSSRSNPWVELFADRMAYHFKEAQDSSPLTVTVDNPAGNEPSQFPLSADPGTRSSYCVIVFLPNPTNTGNTLIVAGTDSQATEAGGDFITSEEDLKRLQALFHREAFPYFQVLLRIARSNGTPLGSEIVSYRVIPR